MIILVDNIRSRSSSNREPSVVINSHPEMQNNFESKIIANIEKLCERNMKIMSDSIPQGIK